MDDPLADLDPDALDRAIEHLLALVEARWKRRAAAETAHDEAA